MTPDRAPRHPSGRRTTAAPLPEPAPPPAGPAPDAPAEPSTHPSTHPSTDAERDALQHDPIRVLAAVVIPPHLEVSGAVTAALELSAALARHVPEVRIDAARMAADDGVERRGDLDVQRLRAKLPLSALAPLWERLPNRARTPLYRSDLAALVRRGEYDLVHLHNPIPTLELKRVAEACLREGVPYVFSTHGLVEVASGGSAYRIGPAGRWIWDALVERPLRFVLRHAAAVLALSEADRAILERYGYPPERVWIVPNGVHPPQEAPAGSAEVQRVCARYGIPSAAGAPTCFFLGNHTPNKGLHVLLDAFLASERPYRLVVGGSKRDHLDYASYAERCRPGQSITFTGLIADEDLGTLYELADLFVFPTLADTFPLVVLEAMAHGLPVLSTRVGGIPHQVEDDRGRLVAPGDPDALRAAFEALSADRAALARMGARAAEVARERFSWPAAAARAHQAYRAVLEGASAAR